MSKATSNALIAAASSTRRSFLPKFAALLIAIPSRNGLARSLRSEVAAHAQQALREGESRYTCIARPKRVNICEFGALSGSDCSMALQRAIDYLESVPGNDGGDSGGVIEFDAGVWYISGVRVRKSGVRFVGAGKRATLIANREVSAPMLVLKQDDSSRSPVIADIGFEHLQFRNVVHRADGSESLIRGFKAERLYFTNVDFVSSPISPVSERHALECSFIKTDTFESTWSNCHFWGAIGSAIEIPDGPQSDTLLFRECVWSYCTIACVFGLGNASGINGPLIESCKIIGSQGGSYVSSGNDDFALTRCLSVSGNVIEVEDGTNFRERKAVFVGESSRFAQYAIVRSVSGKQITLDRTVACQPGDSVVHGCFGFVFGHTSMPHLRSVQLEGCDVGVYLVGARAFSADSTLFSSCARGILVNAKLRFLKLSSCSAATRGRMKNGVSWELVSVIGDLDAANQVQIEGLLFEDSAYYAGSRSSAVANHSASKVQLTWSAADSSEEESPN